MKKINNYLLFICKINKKNKINTCSLNNYMLYYQSKFYGGIGEVVNTADCGSVMQGFDSLISPQMKESNFYKFFFCARKIVIFQTLLKIVIQVKKIKNMCYNTFHAASTAVIANLSIKHS